MDDNTKTATSHHHQQYLHDNVTTSYPNKNTWIDWTNHNMTTRRTLIVGYSGVLLLLNCLPRPITVATVCLCGYRPMPKGMVCCLHPYSWQKKWHHNRDKEKPFFSDHIKKNLTVGVIVVFFGGKLSTPSLLKAAFSPASQNSHLGTQL